MKPWQAWTVTICAVLICIVQLYQGFFLVGVHMGLNMISEEVDKMAEKTDKDWDEAIRKAKEPSGLDRFLPEKPKARATRNSGQ